MQQAPKALLAGLPPSQVAEFPAWVRARQHAPMAVRVVAVAMPAERAEAARERARRESRRKGHEPQAETGFTAGFVLLATNLTAAEATAADLADAYRWRWQIEREFRRFKGITRVRRLRQETPESIRTHLLGALVVWLLAHRAAHEADFFPWGCPLRDVD